MSKEEIRVENIEELAERAQKACYNGRVVDQRQLDETKQFYMMGFFEGMQIGNKCPEEKFDTLFKDVSGSIQKRIMELFKK